MNNLLMGVLSQGSEFPTTWEPTLVSTADIYPVQLRGPAIVVPIGENKAFVTWKDNNYGYHYYAPVEWDADGSNVSYYGTRSKVHNYETQTLDAIRLKDGYVATISSRSGICGYLTIFTDNGVFKNRTSIFGASADSGIAIGRIDDTHMICVDYNGLMQVVTYDSALNTFGSASSGSPGSIGFTGVGLCTISPTKFVVVSEKGRYVATYEIDGSYNITELDTLTRTAHAYGAYATRYVKKVYDGVYAFSEGDNISTVLINESTGEITDGDTITVGTTYADSCIDVADGHIIATNTTGNNLDCFVVNETTGGLTAVYTNKAISPSRTRSYLGLTNNKKQLLTVYNDASNNTEVSLYSLA